MGGVDTLTCELQRLLRSTPLARVILMTTSPAAAVAALPRSVLWRLDQAGVGMVMVVLYAHTLMRLLTPIRVACVVHCVRLRRMETMKNSLMGRWSLQPRYCIAIILRVSSAV